MFIGIGGMGLGLMGLADIGRDLLGVLGPVVVLSVTNLILVGHKGADTAALVNLVLIRLVRLVSRSTGTRAIATAMTLLALLVLLLLFSNSNTLLLDMKLIKELVEVNQVVRTDDALEVPMLLEFRV